jgi:integrase/recombinase XerD
MSDAGIPLRIIQEVSGHRDLSELQKYLEVRDAQVLGAITALSMLSPVGEEVRKSQYLDQNAEAQQVEKGLSP